MYAASVGRKQLGRTTTVIAAVVVLAVVAVFIAGKIKDAKEGGESQSFVGETGEQREEFLRTLGIQVDSTSSIAEVKVPEEFDERFATYNEMLKTQGFDLEPLRGKAIKKCTYTVTNRPELGEGINAVVLVRAGKIVGGHLLNPKNGDLQPLSKISQPEEGGPSGAQDTILPATPAVERPTEAPAEVEVSAYPTE
ncbi:MAG: DUF4830 domain-containing protein [Oscillospiraceae bacterium]